DRDWSSDVCFRSVVGGERASALLYQCEREHCVVEVVVFGHAVDVLGQARRAARAIPGMARGDRLGQPPRGEPIRERPAPLGLQDLAYSRATDTLDRFPEQTADCTTEPRAADAVPQRSARDGRT